MKKSIVMSLISTLALFGADVTNSIGMVFKEMPHSATVKSFYMGETEVTQAQWKTIMGNNQHLSKNSTQKKAPKRTDFPRKKSGNMRRVQEVRHCFHAGMMNHAYPT